MFYFQEELFKFKSNSRLQSDRRVWWCMAHRLLLKLPANNPVFAPEKQY